VSHDDVGGLTTLETDRRRTSCEQSELITTSDGLPSRDNNSTKLAVSIPTSLLLSQSTQLHFLTKTFAETFAEPKLWSKYLLKSKSEVISLSEKHGD